MTDKKLTCLECNKSVANTPNVLARHLRTTHGVDWIDYVVKHEHAGVWPMCVCGCNQRLIWKKGGFGKYLRGHDAKGLPQLTSTPESVQDDIRPGWVFNKFTGKEEHITSDDEIMLFKQCLARDDRVTHDHGIMIPWKDSSGKIRMFRPSFKHLQHRLLLTIETQTDVEFNRRLAGYRDWCDMHKYTVIMLSRVEDGFDVIYAYRCKE